MEGAIIFVIRAVMAGGERENRYDIGTLSFRFDSGKLNPTLADAVAPAWQSPKARSDRYLILLVYVVEPR